MSPILEVRVPDIGDFTDVPVIEIHVSAGDTVQPEDPLVTLESDKATMDVPAPEAGVITQVSVGMGDRVSEGSVLLLLESGDRDGGEPASESQPTPEAQPTPGGQPTSGGQPAPEAQPTSGGQPSPEGQPTAAAQPAPEPQPTDDKPPRQHPDAPDSGASSDGASSDRDARVLIIGSGPGGYTAAFRAADLGLKTIMVERYDRLGGVCLNVGCIPSKALLHAARVIAEAQEMGSHGVHFDSPRIDLDELRSWKESVVDKLTGGLEALSRARKVEVVHGEARFTGPNSVQVGDRTITFDNCIIACGSEAATLPQLPDDRRIIYSTRALGIEAIPRRLLVIGCGIIGLEMATVYDALGSRITLVEMLDQLIPGCDPDLVKPLHKRISARYEAIHLETSVETVEAHDSDGLHVKFSNGDGQMFDQVLVAIGRRPNGNAIDASAAGVNVDDKGFIAVDSHLRTNVSHIYAIGDVVGGPMLAHKASHEGKTAAEVIAGDESAEFDPRAIPSVAYTDPEVAWMGLTEITAAAEGIEYEKAVIPWSASGRALGLGRPEGQTKLLFEPGGKRLLGAGIVGVGAGELIAETVHALEMGSDAQDIALTIHPHPTLTETVMLAAEMAAGTITDLPLPKRRAAR